MLVLDVEFHSNDRAANASTVEIATTGIGAGEARRIKQAWHDARERLSARTPQVDRGRATPGTCP